MERPADPSEAWAGTEAELKQAHSDLDAVLASGTAKSGLQSRARSS